MPKHLFSSRRYLQKRHELIAPPGGKKSRGEWVVARSLCHYQLFDLTDIPASRRDNVLQLKMKQWSPFSDYGSYHVWQGSQVQVWIWDKQKQQQLVTEAGIAKVLVMPETVLRPRAPPSQPGSPSITGIATVQLIDCLEGVEGQIWKHGLLIGSRWWPQLPSSIEWDQLQRTHGLPALPEISSVLQLPLLDRPWGRHKAKGSKLTAVHEQLAVMVGAGILTVLLSWQLVGILKWRQALVQRQAEISELTEKITPILSTRNQAMADKEQFEQILALNSFPSQLELIVQVAEKLPGPEAKLLEWSYQTGTLSFTVETKQPDPTFYVKTFQAIPLFKEVKAETGSGRNANQIVISMQVAK